MSEDRLLLKKMRLERRGVRILVFFGTSTQGKSISCSLISCSCVLHIGDRKRPPLQLLLRISKQTGYPNRIGAPPASLDHAHTRPWSRQPQGDPLRIELLCFPAGWPPLCPGHGTRVESVHSIIASLSAHGSQFPGTLDLTGCSVVEVHDVRHSRQIRHR